MLKNKNVNSPCLLSKTLPTNSLSSNLRLLREFSMSAELKKSDIIVDNFYTSTQAAISNITNISASLLIITYISTEHSHQVCIIVDHNLHLIRSSQSNVRMGRIQAAEE